MYKLEYLPSALKDILEIEATIYELNASAAIKFVDSIGRLPESLSCHPLMYPVYEHDNYFRSIVLPYRYLLFYHVEEDTKIVRVHRVLHGMRDVKSIMENEG